MSRLSLFVATSIAVLSLSFSARADDEARSPWHVDLDASYGRAETGFVSMPMPDAACPDGCGPAGYTLPGLRLAAGFGYAGLSLEAGLSGATSSAESETVIGHAGVRADTSWDAAVSVFLRFAYVRALTGLPGEGGRAGIGLTVRPVLGFALYAEASADARSVPSSMNEVGTLFAWSTFLGGGMRLSFGH